MGRWYVGATPEHSHKVFDDQEDFKVCDCGDTDAGRARAKQIVEMKAELEYLRSKFPVIAGG